MRLALLVLAFIPLRGELLRVSFRFQPTDCASCVESLSQRLRRVRGVSEVRLQAAASRVEIDLAPGNAVRLNRLREVVEQDGTKVISTGLRATGECFRQDEAWMLRYLAQAPAIPLPGRPPKAEGKCEVDH